MSIKNKEAAPAAAGGGKRSGDIENSAEQTKAEVHFVYKEQDRCDIPRDVTHVTIDASVRTIRQYSFCDCKDLREVTMHDGVVWIGSHAFMWCKSLTRIRLPPSVRVIMGAAFYECTALSDVELNDGLEGIQFKAFEGCAALESLVLPKSIKCIYDLASYQKNISMREGGTEALFKLLMEGSVV